MTKIENSNYALFQCYDSSLQNFNANVQEVIKQEVFENIDNNFEKKIEQNQLEKISNVEKILKSHEIDLEKFKNLTKESGGLLLDKLRKRIWPILMQTKGKDFGTCNMEDLTEHKDYKQVVLDVNRTLKRFPPNIDSADREIFMKQLTKIIIRILDKHKHLFYYQGYHDVAITFLLVMGEEESLSLIETLSLTHLREFMRKDMKRTEYYLTYIYPIIRVVSKELYTFLLRSCVGTIFCLPWLITWFAHTLPNYEDVVRLYDFFLASPHMMPMYVAAAIVLSKEEAILRLDCEMTSVHSALVKIPKEIDLDEIILKADRLYRLYPPDQFHEEVELLIEKKEREEKEALLKIKEQKLRLQKLKSRNRILHSIFSNYRSFSKTQTAFVLFFGVASIAGYYFYSKY